MTCPQTDVEFETEDQVLAREIMRRIQNGQEQLEAAVAQTIKTHMAVALRDLNVEFVMDIADSSSHEPI
jgi:hypothetical protein